jgi:hypothetical protein
VSPTLRVALSVVGVVVCLTGGVFFLQGIGLLGGSFMSHTLTWTFIGAVMVGAGAGLLRWARPRAAGGSR